ncbi:MAG TPA: hypothetical protein EYN06_07850 [Myxococcales bacterium]|nr:hypothetical protein [Myxococcales bacterium]
MRVCFIIFILFSQPVAAFEVPIQLPKEPMRCVYEGVLPLTGTQMRWEYQTKSDGSYDIAMPKDFNVALLKRHLGDEFESILDWSATGRDRHAGSGQNTRIYTQAKVKLRSGESVVFESTLDIEVVCTGLAKEIQVGRSWRCTESSVDGWTVTPAVMPQSSGEERRKIDIGYTLLRKESFESDAVGKVDALVIQSKDSEGNVQRVWRDLQSPWCELRKQRLKIGQVVGTVNLLSRETRSVSTKSDGVEDTWECGSFLNGSKSSSDGQQQSSCCFWLLVLGLLSAVAVLVWRKTRKP